MWSSSFLGLAMSLCGESDTSGIFLLFRKRITRYAGYVSGFVYFSYNLRIFIPHDMLNVQVAGE